MPHRILNRSNLLLRATRLFTVFRFGFIVVLTFDDPMFLLHLRNIQIRNMKPVFFLNPFLYLLIGRLSFRTRRIDLIQIYLYLDMIVRFLLGQTNNRLPVPREFYSIFFPITPYSVSVPSLSARSASRSLIPKVFSPNG